MKILKLILCVLVGLMFMNAGLDKFLHYMPVPPLEPELQRVDDAFRTVKWLMPLVGTSELFGGLLFILPKTRALGALILFPVMVGIMVHTTTYAPEALLIPAIIFIIYLFILWDNREKFKPIICSTKK